MAPVTTESLDPNLVNHGDPNLQCSPATAWSVFVFFASNYLSHCATVKTYPGSSQLDTFIATALALFLPSYGITRALFSIVRRSRLRRNRNELERAAAAGALRMVVRNDDWKPMVGDHIRPSVNGLGEILLWSGGSLPRDPDGAASEIGAVSACVFPNIEDREGDFDDIESAGPFSFTYHVERKRQNFHGKAILPPGYSWGNVHPEAKVSWAETPAGMQDAAGGSPSISSNYNWIQSLVGLFQAGSAALTLYKSRGDQIQRYGYAAFGLTVVPYLVMTIVNLVAQIASADYSNVYMVSSPEMEEARRHGGVFDGVVGHLEPGVEEDEADDPEYMVKSIDGISVLERVSGSDSYPQTIAVGDKAVSPELGNRDIMVPFYTTYELHSRSSGMGDSWRYLQYGILSIILGGLSLIVVGALTHFENGQSTQSQRGWIMSWLVVGLAIGWPADAAIGMKHHFFGAAMAICSSAIFSIPAVGGFAVVAGMLREYGICESS
ncbi:hypothetical protein C8A03DRAFT_17919 [Achaetomium macrosporum]|uniref:Uncharacterized protein n=1 Tax=Achaetomium macrosporum TaxID=79813 RepID=A0AAN7C5I5_9PEZI|nr:hypothetical protein C8A03DRAFT_17919 [Achaetomium macrosporum]